LADARRGILWMLVAMLSAVTTDTINKALSQNLPVPQLVWGRFIFHMVLMVLLLGRRLPQVVVTRRLGLQVVRSFCLICAASLFVYGLHLLPMAEANGILFIAPILVAVLSAPLLGERVDWRRWVGVAVGFAGALIIIRPGSGVMHLAALFPLGSACLFALYQIATKQLSRTESTMTTLFYTGIVGALVTSFAVPFFWIAPSALEWFFLAMLGVLSGCTHFCLIKAFEAAPASTVSPFIYSTLIWATLSGYVFFNDLPDLWTVVGAAIIAGSGLYIAFQERLQRDGGE
jgi:drug/metabolite transporter (DMT)-like permease